MTPAIISAAAVTASSETFYSSLNAFLLALFGAGLTFLGTWFWFRKEAAEKKSAAIADDHQKLIGRVIELESKLALVNQSIIPFNTVFQSILVKELTHYHTPEMDALMVKIGPPYALTDDEAARLSVLLDERTRDMGELITERERGAALILPEIIKRARDETALLNSAEAMKMTLVSVAAVVG